MDKWWVASCAVATAGVFKPSPLAAERQRHAVLHPFISPIALGIRPRKPSRCRWIPVALCALLCACGARFSAISRDAQQAHWRGAADKAAAVKGGAYHLAAWQLGEALRQAPNDGGAYLRMLQGNRRYGHAQLDKLRRAAPGGPLGDLLAAENAARCFISQSMAHGWRQSDSSTVRALVAGQVAGHLSDAALDALREDISPEVRQHAVSALCRRRATDERRTRAVQALRFDPDARVRSAAVACGSFFGAQTDELLREALEDEHRTVVLAALQALQRQRTDASLEALRSVAVGTVSERAVYANAVLARQRDAAALVRLQDALMSADAPMRAAALSAMSSMGIAGAERALEQALADPAPQVRFIAASQLLSARRHQADAQQALRELMSGEDTWAQSAARALAQHGDTQGTAHLRTLLARLSDGDSAALAAQIRRSAGIDALSSEFVSLMGHADVRVRLAAAAALWAGLLR